ncbi:hypothetical protein SELMODRAFT_123397 [Selaginella moellendorffii]|uniref:Inward rectifier potassium channel C-terminal domain-containing protein n=1 Tax=Selaginella moellendorffii TaxID=88036 RepID=D8SRZ6_SELML|nr:hypothetical protein SELMODRAFT_130202 [Selaginella moellendorffii]EFJ12877.1 hypothetical protein SELMODRAFT_123397 [Selaginella moellendorffii]
MECGHTQDTSRLEARNRWRRLKNTVAFAAAIKSSLAHDLLEDKLHVDPVKGNDSVATGAAAQASMPVKAKGRKGMEGLVVQQDRGYMSCFQDFYVACLKLPVVHFFIGVFLAPVALASIFTPLYLSDAKGLKLVESQEAGSSCDSSKIWSCLNVFLYSLSLSTTFGGSPISAISPFCLLVANLHTLMAQFLFVFLSGAVFARMSQPAHPIRCSKKAIIKNNDFGTSDDEDGRSKVFVIRLVLTGPPPCELVDAKIRLTFRIYVRLPSGSMFCSTQDLDLVRSEVAYLRYGLTVRHVINSKSPISGHTLDTLAQGDASFSLTIMGVERSSMQPIFHVEDYFICDGDVIWDGEYLDFVGVNDKGLRVLDHSKIDMLKPFKVAGVVTQAIARMEGEVARHKAEADLKEEKNHEPLSESDWKTSGVRIRKLWKTISGSK